MKGIRAGLVVSIFSTAIAAIYLMVYLYRWELHRALVAGVLFVAGEIAIATTLVLRKIETLRVAQSATIAVPPPKDDHTETPAPTGDRDEAVQRQFRWLGMDRMNVFIPVLLGANVIISGIAWLVEHLARHAPAKGGRSVERSLTSLALPAGGFVGLATAGTVAIDEGPSPSGRSSRWLRLLAPCALAALLVVLFTLALSGRSKPDADTTGLRSNVVISVDTRNGLDHDLAARSLVEACHPLIENQRVVELRPLEANRYLIVLEPALGEQARRRFFGCLDDGVLERVHADLHGHAITPAEG